MKISIRPANIQDAPAISACVQAAYAHYIERMGTRPGPMLGDYAEIVKEHLVYVACVAHVENQSKEIAGVLVLMRVHSGILLDNVAVNPKHQGKKIGKQLIEFAEVKSSELGYDEIQLYTHEKMTENIAMYKSLGYAEFDRRTENGFNRVYMRKNV